MKGEAKIWKFARSLIAKHGQQAFKLAGARAQRKLERGDYRIASGWARVADLARRMSTTEARRLPPADTREPSLDEVLSGQTTKAMMDADKVGRDDLDRMLDEAKRKRE
jgi:hypothetical protein